MYGLCYILLGFDVILGAIIVAYITLLFVINSMKKLNKESQTSLI